MELEIEVELEILMIVMSEGDQFIWIVIKHRLYLIRSFNRMMNLDKLDPDWKFATNHGLANIAGIPNNQQETSEISDKINNNSLICKCCYEHVYKTPVPLWENSK